MKAVGLFFVAMLVSFGLCACNDGDSGIDAKKVSVAVLRAFEQRFPSAVAVDWDREGRFYVAEFRAPVAGGQSVVMCEMEAWFDLDANWRMTVVDAAFNMLPQEVRDGLKGGVYSVWRVEDVHVVECNGKDTMYLIEVEQGKDERDLLFNSGGELVRESRDIDVKSLL